PRGDAVDVGPCIVVVSTLLWIADAGNCGRKGRATQTGIGPARPLRTDGGGHRANDDHDEQRPDGFLHHWFLLLCSCSLAIPLYLPTTQTLQPPAKPGRVLHSARASRRVERAS